MRTTHRSRSVRIALVLAVALSVVAGCQPTGDLRCDTLVVQRARAEALGYRLRCDAPFSGVSSSGRSVLGWTEHDTHTIWLWPDKLSGNALRKVAWHEIGHVVWDRKGHHGTQADEERWSDGYAYCAEPIKGVSYALRPASCASYR
jgi:hypothetical protein